MIYSTVKSVFCRLAHRRQVARQRKPTLSRASELLISGEEIRLDIGAGTTHRQDGWLTLVNNGICDLWWDLAD